MAAPRGAAAALAGLSMALAAGAALAEGDDYPFMPPGGRGLLSGLAGDDPARIAEAAARQASAAEWRAWAAGIDPGLPAAALDTFAAYAAVNFPLAAERQAAVAGGGAAALPPDGKDLAIAQCQYCHSLFSGYLMQNRDETSWLGTFKAPFHKEIPMNEAERATFASYSAINMPLAFQDVPPELRF